MDGGDLPLEYVILIYLFFQVHNRARAEDLDGPEAGRFSVTERRRQGCDVVRVIYLVFCSPVEHDYFRFIRNGKYLNVNDARMDGGVGASGLQCWFAGPHPQK